MSLSCDRWKTASNVYRGEPWHIKSIPTIVKLSDEARDPTSIHIYKLTLTASGIPHRLQGLEIGRLVEHDVEGSLGAFIGH
jgi:hypothetical protein